MALPRSVGVSLDLDVSPSADGQGNGNITGFTSFDYGVGAKWLELLKEIAPSVTRVVVVCDPAITSGSGYGALSSPCRRR